MFSLTETVSALKIVFAYVSASSEAQYKRIQRHVGITTSEDL
ncbi:hypothetical protein FACS1894122_11070 [Alphaproteobacteria bacterium]|nr:hypothetical protein FACS1894122_11070 [Alphaproteobacteria bacterium]